MAGCKMCVLAVQMGILVAAGAVLGYVDHTRRPVMVNPPAIAPPPPAATGQTPAKPADAHPAAPANDQKPKPETPAPADHPSEHTTAPTTPAQPANPATGEQIDPELVKQGHITLAQAYELFNTNPPAIFIDARRKEVYEAGHVRDAFRLALDAFKDQIPAHLDSMPRDATYVVYCEGGDCDESVAVQKQLLLAAYAKVYVMHAGYPGWVKAGYPTQTGEDPIEAADGRP